MNHTLNSRLRILVAKTYRAERMYASMRNSAGASAPSMTTVANEVRASEWQLSHEQLRRSLSAMVQRSGTSAIADELEALLGKFSRKVSASKKALEQGTEFAKRSLGRKEYTEVLNGALDLVKHKARVQSCSLVVDELITLLEYCGRVSRTELSKHLQNTIDAELIDDESTEEVEATTGRVVNMQNQFAQRRKAAKH